MNLHTHRVSIHAMYYKIAIEHAESFAASDSELVRLQTNPVLEDDLENVLQRIEECYGEREQAAVVAITFAGMTLEAFFYDYAAERLGDTFVKENLDKIDIKSKFLVYPLLACSKRPDKGGKAYASLKSLVALRNDLVHFKSKAFDIKDLSKAADYHSEFNERLKVGVENAIASVALVMEELDKLHGPGSSFAMRIKWSV